MVKDWLIRTKNNHILGPVSKEKVKHLISNGSIRGEDEICSGNGYWIYIKEQDLVAKYIFGEDKQNFNPVQETEPVLYQAELSQDDLAYPGDDSLDEEFGEDEFGNLMPSANDLEYPDFGDEKIESQTDTTMIDVNLNALKDYDENSGELENSEPIIKKKQPVPKQTSAPAPRKTPKKKLSAKKSLERTEEVMEEEVEEYDFSEISGKINTKNHNSLMSKNVLILLGIILVTIAMLLFFFRKSFLKQIMSQATDSLVSPVHAQEIVTKKKSGSPF